MLLLEEGCRATRERDGAGGAGTQRKGKAPPVLPLFSLFDVVLAQGGLGPHLAFFGDTRILADAQGSQSTHRSTLGAFRLNGVSRIDRRERLGTTVKKGHHGMWGEIKALWRKLAQTHTHHPLSLTHTSLASLQRPPLPAGPSEQVLPCFQRWR